MIVDKLIYNLAACDIKTAMHQLLQRVAESHDSPEAILKQLLCHAQTSDQELEPPISNKYRLRFLPGL